MTTLALVLITAAVVIFLVSAWLLWRVRGPGDRQRWVNRVRPARLWRGRGRRRRAAVIGLAVVLGLAVAGSVLVLMSDTAGAGSLWWLQTVATIMIPGAVITLDASAHAALDADEAAAPTPDNFSYSQGAQP